MPSNSPSAPHDRRQSGRSSARYQSLLVLGHSPAPRRSTRLVNRRSCIVGAFRPLLCPTFVKTLSRERKFPDGCTSEGAVCLNAKSARSTRCYKKLNSAQADSENDFGGSSETMYFIG